MTVKDLRLVQGSWRDFRTFLELERLCFGKDAWPWIDVLSALTVSDTVRLKALLDDAVVGFVLADRRGKNQTGWIASIGVHPDARRQGVGSQLLRAAETALQTRRVRLMVRASNKDAQALYLQTGYGFIDEWPAYYRDGENALVMEKRLLLDMEEINL